MAQKLIMFYNFLFILLFSQNKLFISKRIDSNRTYITIFITGEKGFYPKFKNKFYKIITTDKQSLKEKYNLGIIFTNETKDLEISNIRNSDFFNIYYIWKNYRPLPKYIGFISYSNYFKFYDQIPDLDKIFENYNVILPKYSFERPSIKKNFKLFQINEITELIDIIKRKKYEYYDIANTVIDKKEFYIKNIFIMKKEDFILYSEFIYDIMQELYKKDNLIQCYDIKKCNWNSTVNKKKNILNFDFERKKKSFILEILTNIFYFYHFKKIYEIEIIGNYLEKFNEEKKFIELCQKNILFQNIPSSRPDPKISIIVPIYNKEKYLLTAIRSVQNQNFKDFELILVDDFSKDSSLKLMQEEAERDNRIKVIKNEKNRGTLFTRYNGARNASGKYLMQLDPDDAFSNPHTLSLLYNIIEDKKVDIVHFSSITGKLNSLYRDNSGSFDEEKLIKQPELKHYLKIKNKLMYEWNKIYKTSIYLEAFDFIGKEFYEEHHCYLQDKIVTFSILRIAESVFTIKDCLIWYNVNSESGVNIPFSDKKLYDAYRTFTFLDKNSDDSIEDKLEFIKAIECFLSFEGLNEAAAKSKKYRNLYINFCEKHAVSINLPRSTKKVLMNFLYKINQYYKIEI